ncbi:MAG TPA: TonB-dependent receptor [Pyrinomonadaceae bacterium]
MSFHLQRLMTHRWTRAVTALFVLTLFSVAALAQTETGQITGKVIDPNGAVIAGANVTVKSAETGRELSATANDEGVFTVTNLQPGNYDVTVQAGSFEARTQRVNVTVGAKLSIETQLGIAAVGGTVDVVAGAGGVEVNTQTQELSNVITGTQIRELPTLTRNPYDLVGISGNASADPGGSADRGAGFAINGQRASSTNVLLDGADNNDAFTATVGQAVPLDSVQELRVITSNFSAEYGRASGGIVSVATRAGSNEFHGSLYEFNRVSRLASNGFANNATNTPKGVFARNQFGYSIGGPVLKNKLFFFSSTEWIRVRSTGTVTTVVPTAALINASAAATKNFFAQYPLEATPTSRVFTAAETAGLFNVTAGSTFGLFAAANPNLPVFQEVQSVVPTDFGGGSPQNSYQTVNRVDWNLSDTTQIYGRYAIQKQLFFEGSNAFSPYKGFNTGVLNFNQNALVSLTHTFSPTLVSQTKLVFNRLTNVQPLGENPNGPTLYLSGTATTTFGNTLALPGYLPFNPGSAIPFGGPQNLGQLYEDVNYTRGNHQFRFGGQFVYIQDNRAFGAFANSVETLGTNATQGLDNFLLGQLFTFQAAIDPQGKFPGQSVTLPVSQPSFQRSNRYKEFALYANDSWRVTPRLTLNFGLRYEYFGPQKNKDPLLDANLYFEGGNFMDRIGNPTELAAAIRNSQVMPSPNSPTGALWKSDWNNFAPRIGFAWDVFGDGKMSVRGGYGMAYERNFGNVTFNVIQNPPNYAVIALEAGTDIPQAQLPVFTSNAGPLAGAGITKVLPAVSLRAVDPNIRTAFAHFWSAAVERELAQGTVVSLEYSGSAGRDLYALTNINRPGYGRVYLGDASFTSRLNNQYTDINFRSNGGKSNYNGLTASIDSTGWRDMGLQFTARYTYGVAKDNLSATFGFSDTTRTLNSGFLDPFNPDLDYGYADFDVRHRFSSSFNWQIPFAKNMTGVAKQVLDGWALTGLFQAQTGGPYSIFDCTLRGRPGNYCARLVPTGPIPGSASNVPDPDIANQFIFVDLSNQTPGNQLTGPFDNRSYLPPFPADMTRRNQFRGPGYWNFDAAVHKNFKFGERYTLQFRAEMFNIFNHANLFLVAYGNEVNSGYIPAARGFAPNATTGERRNIQLALKFIF